jgi:glutathione synthase
MKIAFFVNDIRKEEKGYTTTRIAKEAHNAGHQVWYIDAEGFAMDPDGSIRARAYGVPRKRYTKLDGFLKDLQSPSANKERIIVDELDVLMLRSDPAQEYGSRSWAQQVGMLYGRVALRHGVIVLNDPNGLAKASNKMYFELFPEEVRPKTLITRDRQEIRDFADEHKMCVLKPIQGSGGQNVFLVSPDNYSNLNQMIDAVSRDGYVIVQEYLKAAEQGDTRLFLMNGIPLRVRGKYAAFRRVRTGEDLRSNIHAGGRIAEAVIDDTVLRVAEIVRPKLVQDGMFLVGLDIVGDKLMEINVFSPGGLGSAQKFTGVNFSRVVLQAIERKVQYMEFYQRNFDNVEMSTL